MLSTKKLTASLSINKAASVFDSVVLSSMTVRLGQQFYIAIPYLSVLKTFFFDGKNVIDFLDQFLDFYRDYKLTNDKKMKRLLRYCDMRIERTIMTIKEWQKRS